MQDVRCIHMSQRTDRELNKQEQLAACSGKDVNSLWADGSVYKIVLLKKASFFLEKLVFDNLSYLSLTVDKVSGMI